MVGAISYYFAVESRDFSFKLRDHASVLVVTAEQNAWSFQNLSPESQDRVISAKHRTAVKTYLAFGVFNVCSNHINFFHKWRYSLGYVAILRVERIRKNEFIAYFVCQASVRLTATAGKLLGFTTCLPRKS